MALALRRAPGAAAARAAPAPARAPAAARSARAVVPAPGGARWVIGRRSMGAAGAMCGLRAADADAAPPPKPPPRAPAPEAPPPGETPGAPPPPGAPPGAPLPVGRRRRADRGRARARGRARRRPPRALCAVADRQPARRRREDRPVQLPVRQECGREIDSAVREEGGGMRGRGPSSPRRAPPPTPLPPQHRRHRRRALHQRVGGRCPARPEVVGHRVGRRPRRAGRRGAVQAVGAHRPVPRLRRPPCDRRQSVPLLLHGRGNHGDEGGGGRQIAAPDLPRQVGVGPRGRRRGRAGCRHAALLPVPGAARAGGGGQGRGARGRDL